jgi:hypothetical protein
MSELSESLSFAAVEHADLATLCSARGVRALTPGYTPWDHTNGIRLMAAASPEGTVTALPAGAAGVEAPSAATAATSSIPFSGQRLLKDGEGKYEFVYMGESPFPAESVLVERDCAFFIGFPALSTR